MLIGVGIALLVWSVWSNLDEMRRPLVDPLERARPRTVAPNDDSGARGHPRRSGMDLGHLAARRSRARDRR